MVEYSIIDKDTFEVYSKDEYSKAFICESSIADIVAMLNKKGYKTVNCYGGDYEIAYYEVNDVDIAKLEEIKEKKGEIIKRVGDSTFDFWMEKWTTHIYISFDKEYKFDNMPKGFNLENENLKSAIDGYVSYYNEDITERRSREDIEKELEEKRKILKDWVEKLPNINERND